VDDYVVNIGYAIRHESPSPGGAGFGPGASSLGPEAQALVGRRQALVRRRRLKTAGT
jgi:hypothetical protein